MRQAKPNFPKQASNAAQTKVEIPLEDEEATRIMAQKNKKRAVLTWTEEDMAKALKAQEDGKRTADTTER